jgi:NAD(P)-dependent dehydrogenase (short-subunit alcohol dehydrogenase family)
MAVLDKFRLDDKVVIITGASSGLGVAFAEACAQAGADVVMAARRAEKLEQTADLVRSTGRRALTVATDVTDPQQCEAMVGAAVEEFGRVDVLVNNVGAGTVVPAIRETPEQFRSVVEINLNGSYWAAQACGRIMQPGSSIVNISSVLGLTTGGLPLRHTVQAKPASSDSRVILRSRALERAYVLTLLLPDSSIPR